MSPERTRDLAYTCQCGSVKWSLLWSGEIECAACQTLLEGVVWTPKDALRTAP